MSQDTPAVETQAQAAAPEQSGEINYAAEYSALLEENTRIARDRDNYKAGLLAAKGKQADDDGEVEPTDVAGIVQREIQKIIPTIQSTMASESIGQIISELSSNPDEQRLIKYHFENSVTPNGSLRDRLEIAKLIANKKSIIKSQKEMAVAIQNRSQVTNASQGSGVNEMQAQDSFFSPAQIEYFKKRGLDPAKVKENILKNKK